MHPTDRRLESWFSSGSNSNGNVSPSSSPRSSKRKSERSPPPCPKRSRARTTGKATDGTNRPLLLGPEEGAGARAEGIYQPTNLSRPLEGQAPYVLNTGINYTGPAGLEAGLFYNRVGARLTAAGGSGLPDIYEQPRNALDASLAFSVPGGARARLKATNLLNAEYRFTQAANGFERVQRLYSVGRTVSVGLSWEFN